jgi:hypothetical protein
MGRTGNHRQQVAARDEFRYATWCKQLATSRVESFFIPARELLFWEQPLRISAGCQGQPQQFDRKPPSWKRNHSAHPRSTNFDAAPQRRSIRLLPQELICARFRCARSNKCSYSVCASDGEETVKQTSRRLVATTMHRGEGSLDSSESNMPAKQVF